MKEIVFTLSKEIAEYLISNPLITIFLCLGIGCLIGKIKIGSFSLGATASTMIVAMAVCLWAGQYGSFAIDSNLRTVFFAMFAFALGFDVGPSFFKALRSSGIKIVVLAVFYALMTGGFTLLAGKLMGYDISIVTGLFAGAFTQTAIIGNNPEDGVMLAYTMTYFIGTISSIVFSRYLLPLFLRVDLLKETKRKASSSVAEEEKTDDIGVVQTRAFALCENSEFIGKSVGDVEDSVKGDAEIYTLFRDGKLRSVNNGTVLDKNDIITVAGDINTLNSFDNKGLQEVSDAKYFSIKQTDAQIVLATDVDEDVYRTLTHRGILIKKIERSGKHKKNFRKLDMKKGDVIHVYGPEKAIKKAAFRLGYIKDNGITSDIPFFAFALMFGLMIGSISFALMGRKVGLGASFGALIIGLISGWLYDKHPKFGHITESTRWFIKSIGLNLYIAALGLTSTLAVKDLVSVDNLILMAVGLVIALLARIPVMYFGKYILKLDTVDLVGGICGSGTNTPALNAITEYTGSSLYAMSFAPGYAVGNVALITVGLLLGYLV